MLKRFRNAAPDLHFGRCDVEGVPFRGRAPLLRESDFAGNTEVVYDAHFFTFDCSQPDQVDPVSKRTYRTVLESIRSGWWQLSCRETRWIDNAAGVPTMHVYIEWFEPYQELTPEAEQTLARQTSP